MAQSKKPPVEGWFFVASEGFELIEAAPSTTAADQAGNYHGPLNMYLKAGFELGDDLGNGQVIVSKKLQN
jgi:hypothetical protein